MPESLNFLNRCLVLLAPIGAFVEGVPGTFPLPEMAVNLSIENPKGENLETIESVKLEQLAAEDETSDGIRLSLLQATLRMFERYLQLYASTPAFLEVFESTLDILTQLQLTQWHTDIEVSWNCLCPPPQKKIIHSHYKKIRIF
jgi:nucleolar protein 14